MLRWQWLIGPLTQRAVAPDGAHAECGAVVERCLVERRQGSASWR